MAVAVGLQRACFVAGFEARLGAEVKWRADRFSGLVMPFSQRERYSGRGGYAGRLGGEYGLEQVELVVSYEAFIWKYIYHEIL